jgi:hypothetical protein
VRGAREEDASAAYEVPVAEGCTERSKVRIGDVACPWPLGQDTSEFPEPAIGGDTFDFKDLAPVLVKRQFDTLRRMGRGSGEAVYRVCDAG